MLFSLFLYLSLSLSLHTLASCDLTFIVPAAAAVTILCSSQFYLYFLFHCRRRHRCCYCCCCCCAFFHSSIHVFYKSFHWSEMWSCTKSRNYFTKSDTEIKCLWRERREWKVKIFYEDWFRLCVHCIDKFSFDFDAQCFVEILIIRWHRCLVNFFALFPLNI